MTTTEQQTAPLPRKGEPLRLEELEERIAPTMLVGAVTVTQAGGNLIITGDQDPNLFAIDGLGLDEGQFRVSGPAGTINGADEFFADGVTGNVTIRLPGGDNVINIHHADIGSNLLPMDGDGNLSVEIYNSNVSRSLTVRSGLGSAGIAISSTEVGGATRIQNRAGQGHFNVTASSLGGPVNITSGAQFNQIEVIDSTFSRAALFNIRGDDGVHLLNSLLGPLVIRGGANSAISTQDVHFDGNLSMVNLNDGITRLHDTTVSGNVVFRGSGVMALHRCTLLGNVSYVFGHLESGAHFTGSQIWGNVNVRGGNAETAVLVSGTEVGGNVNVRVGAASGSGFYVENSTFHRNVMFAFGPGDTLGSINDTLITGNFGLRTGAGENAFAFRRSEFDGNVAIAFGNGDAMTLFEESNVSGNVRVRYGAGEHDFRTESSDFSGNVALAFGNGDTSTLFDRSNVSGNLTLRAGRGDDVFEAHVAHFRSNVFLFFGAGASTVDLQNSRVAVESYISDESVGRLTVRTIDGPAGFVTVNSDLGHTTVASGRGGADMNIRYSSLADISFRSGGGDSVFEAFEADFLGAVRVATGAGDDRVAFDAVTVGGPLTITTGAGHDYVYLERGEAGNGPPSHFLGRVMVNLGPGTDWLGVGTSGNANNSAVFYSTVILNGGTGFLDRLNIVGNGNEFLGGEPTFINFLVY